MKKIFTLLMVSGAAIAASAQSYSLRTNIIGLASTNLNIEASMTLNRNWSLHLPIQYNPFIFHDRKQFRNFYMAPGARYWLLQSYIGSFIGMYGTGAVYSVGNIFGNKHRYEGSAYGLGVSLGHAYQLSRRWNFEWEIGAGLSWVDYKKFQCYKCGDLVSREDGIRFLPNRLALNIVYLF